MTRIQYFYVNSQGKEKVLLTRPWWRALRNYDDLVAARVGYPVNPHLGSVHARSGPSRKFAIAAIVAIAVRYFTPNTDILLLAIGFALTVGEYAAWHARKRAYDYNASIGWK